MQMNAISLVQQKVPFQYSVGGQSINHKLIVAGFGREVIPTCKFVSIQVNEVMQKKNNHNFSSIAEAAKIDQYSSLHASTSSLFLYKHDGYQICQRCNSENSSLVPQHQKSSLEPLSTSAKPIDDNPNDSNKTRSGTKNWLKCSACHSQSKKSVDNKIIKTISGIPCNIMYYDCNKRYVQTIIYYLNSLNWKRIDFFEGEYPVICCVQNYKNQMPDGIWAEFSKSRNLKTFSLYKDNQLEKIISFFEDGTIYFAASLNGLKGTAISLSLNGHLRFIGDVILQDTSLICEGKGTLFYDYYAELSGTTKNNCMLFDGVAVPFSDCLKVIRLKNDICEIETPENGIQIPWKPFNIQKGPSACDIACFIDNQRHVIKSTKRIKETGGSETKFYGLGGYLICESKVDRNGTETKYYYPLPGEGGDYRLKGFTINPSVEGYVTKRWKSLQIKTIDGNTEQHDELNYDKSIDW